MSKTENLLVSLSIGALLWAAGCSTLRPADSARIQGTWKGQEIGGNTEGSRCLIISGSTLEFRGANPDDWCKGTFTLREDTDPRRLVGTITECRQAEYIDKTVCAIYRLQGDTLTIAGYEPGNSSVPSAFDAPGVRHFVLKRESR
ncbi:MAG TPA: hypothetical protein VMB80_16655 [Candidatus Acidoferrum sp.]|nr:hypothetical protein [Candidatus Acidoferrum sp.]